MADTNDLRIAIIKKDLNTVKKLVDDGVEINAINKYNESALITAILSGDLEIVHFLLDKGSKLHLRFKKGYICLHYAVEINSYEISKILLEKGADVNATDNFGNTALWYCCSFWNSNSDERILNLLINYQAKTSIKNKYDLDVSYWFDKKEGLAKALAVYQNGGGVSEWVVAKTGDWPTF